ncbi:hypothetical protein LMG28140_02401 [Paraburkholderia metrosideri]|uniref:Uncharacterized protein n=1 Tax=Paraburkholderia metrosideri TaxID=580937 RepID=A0ABM8NKW9_9BURK|nr:hypothetical protein LMG28140_02401 [Paraburkholderia metrosideri]
MTAASTENGYVSIRFLHRSIELGFVEFRVRRNIGIELIIARRAYACVLENVAVA